jgi:hypothetical protein
LLPARVEETIVRPDEEPHGPGDVTVTVRDTGGVPEQGLKVYVFDGASYTGYNKTTDASGQAVSTCRKATTASGPMRTGHTFGVARATTARFRAARSPQ